MAISTILIDVGGVLVRTKSTQQRGVWEQKLGLKKRELTRMVYSTNDAKLATIGKISDDQIWEKVGRKLNLDETELDQLRIDFYAGEELNTNLYSFIQQLKPKYKIVVFSNAWDAARQVYSELFNLDKIVHEMILSAEIGMKKPDKKIYKFVLDYLKVDSSEILYIDDSLKNIQTGKLFGMNAIHFNDNSQAISEIESYLKI